MTKNHKTNFKFIDLFSGIGGFRIAAERQGGECVFSSDIDKKARETYQLNFKEYPHGDITLIPSHDIPSHDLLCAGFPCQPFSHAGKRLGFNDTRGTLFFDVLRILNDKQPKYFILENVSGIISHDKGNTIKVIESCLKSAGYWIKYEVINAKNVGIPQNRNRWYCVGVRKDIEKHNVLNDFQFPQARDLKFKVADIIEENVDKKYNITPTAKTNIEYHLHNTKKDCGNELIIANEIRKSRCNFRCDGISPCLTAKMGTGGNNVPVVVSKLRKFTESECLKLMGFPNNFVIKDNSAESYKQIGNSVVVPIVEDILKELLCI